MNIYVLIMIFSTSASSGGIGIVNQEFHSQEACEVARKTLEKAHTGVASVLRAQGCFKKHL